jgi:hypothetical protein
VLSGLDVVYVTPLSLIRSQALTSSLQFFLGQVRTLQKFGWLANAAVFLNLMIMFISMGVIAHSAPNYSIAVLGSVGGSVNVTSITPNADGVYPPIIHNNGLPDPSSLIGSVIGLMQGVYAYGGAQLFIEFMVLTLPKILSTSILTLLG